MRKLGNFKRRGRHVTELEARCLSLLDAGRTEPQIAAVVGTSLETVIHALRAGASKQERVRQLRRRDIEYAALNWHTVEVPGEELRWVAYPFRDTVPSRDRLPAAR